MGELTELRTVGDLKKWLEGRDDADLIALEDPDTNWFLVIKAKNEPERYVSGSPLTLLLTGEYGDYVEGSGP